LSLATRQFGWIPVCEATRQPNKLHEPINITVRFSSRPTAEQLGWSSNDRPHYLLRVERIGWVLKDELKPTPLVTSAFSCLASE
jgi:hypothetical protein